MTDEVWKRDEIESPCVKVCVLHPEARICLGCHRTADEIAGWSRMSRDERRALIEVLPRAQGAVARTARRAPGAVGRLGSRSERDICASRSG